MITRRECLRYLSAGTGAVFAGSAVDAFAQTSPYKGVVLGVQSYSFRDRGLDEAIAAMKQVGLNSCELWQGHLEPKKVTREEMRKWRETTPLSEFQSVRSKFEKAGIRIHAYNISFKDDFSDAEIERGFEAAKALGTSIITASANTKVVERVVPAAVRHRVVVGMHNHSRFEPSEFATPDDFTRAMNRSPQIAVNLDIGHFTAANFDAVAFLREHHARIVTLHIKDRKRDDGPNMPLGEGDTPIGPVLRMLRDQKWPIPANVEYEYKGGDSAEEVRRCLDYCRRALDA
jgi:sugar phosphate isomerase/epimerase